MPTANKPNNNMSHDDSSSNHSNEGAALPWILEHLLAYPGSYEIPLRTMYTINATQQPHKQSTKRPSTPSLSSGSSADSSPISPGIPLDQHFERVPQSASNHFMNCLAEQISYLPSQPFSLPPSFITSFVRRCFTEDLCLVDFTQALTALDYLKDIENRRKRELTASLRRLGLDKPCFDKAELNKQYPGAQEWITEMEEKERRVEALYTQVYVGLRRWTLINEMRLEPFNKANCVAMLNTLYPPATASPPTSQLTSTILSSQRHAFFRYIQAVEKNGKSVLLNLEQQSRRADDKNGWPVVHEIVDKYLRTANGVIEECLAVTGPDYFRPDAEDRRNARRADSGVSFGSNERPPTAQDASVRSTDPFMINTYSKTPTSASAPAILPTPKKSGTTLERIAREIRKIKSRSDGAKANTITPANQSAAYENAADVINGRSLKKMKSASALGRAGTTPSHSRGGSGERMMGTEGMGISYEIDEAQRQRMIWEAKRAKENRVLLG